MMARHNTILILAAILAAVVGLLLSIAFGLPASKEFGQVAMMITGMLMVAILSMLSRYADSSGRAPVESVSFDIGHARLALVGRVEPHLLDVPDNRGERPWEPSTDRLASHDPVLALAKLRLNIESELRELAFRRVSFYSPKSALRDVIGEMVAKNIFSLEVGNTIEVVLNTCSSAIHGLAVTPEVAMNILDVGEDLIRLLRQADAK